MKKPNKIPETLDEAITMVIANLDAEDIKFIKEQDEAAHFSLGMYNSLNIKFTPRKIVADIYARTGRPRLSWEETALRLAYGIADYRSQDPYVQVGAAIIKQDNDIVVGYNGPPAGIEIDWSDRD